MPGLPDDVKEAFAASGGVGCTYALLPSDEGRAELGVVAALPLAGREIDGAGVGVEFGMDVHLMTRGVVLQTTVGVAGLFDEIVDLTILLDPLDEQQASLVDLVQGQERLGVYIYAAENGSFVVGKAVPVDDEMRASLIKMLDEARNHSASILMPDFQSAVEELAARHEGGQGTP
ncbi:MAG: hypothetical protein PVF51_00335 [Nitrospirota bacterium]|jgi:hypothetical protein